MELKVKDKPEEKETPETPEAAEIPEGTPAQGNDTKDAEIESLKSSVDTLMQKMDSLIGTMAAREEALKGAEKTQAEKKEINERQLEDAKAVDKAHRASVDVFAGADLVDEGIFKGLSDKSTPEEAALVLEKALANPTKSETLKEFQRLSDRLKVATELLAYNPNARVQNTKWYKEYHDFAQKTGIDKVLTLSNATTGFVPQGWSTEVMSLFYQELELATAFMDFEMPHSPFTWPLIGRGKARRRSLPSASLRGVAANEYPEDSSPTKKVTFEAETLSVRQDLLEEFVEDTPEMLMDMILMKVIPETMAEGIESALLNGDTRPHNASDTDRDKGHEATDIELSWDGLRRIAGSQSATYDVGASSGTYDYGDFVKVLRKGGKYLVKPRNGCWCFENNTYLEGHNFDPLKTMDKTNMPTNINGVVGWLMGRPLLVSGEWPLTHTTGAVSDTATENTRGGFLAFNRALFAIGIRRAQTIMQSYDHQTGFFYLTATCRHDFQSTEALETGVTPVAAGINVPL